MGSLIFMLDIFFDPTLGNPKEGSDRENEFISDAPSRRWFTKRNSDPTEALDGGFEGMSL